MEVVLVIFKIAAATSFFGNEVAAVILKITNAASILKGLFKKGCNIPFVHPQPTLANSAST